MNNFWISSWEFVGFAFKKLAWTLRYIMAQLDDLFCMTVYGTLVLGYHCRWTLVWGCMTHFMACGSLWQQIYSVCCILLYCFYNALSRILFSQHHSSHTLFSVEVQHDQNVSHTYSIAFMIFIVTFVLSRLFAWPWCPHLNIFIMGLFHFASFGPRTFNFYLYFVDLLRSIFLVIVQLLRSLHSSVCNRCKSHKFNATLDWMDTMSVSDIVVSF